jgi:hypothetical protein
MGIISLSPSGNENGSVYGKYDASICNEFGCYIGVPFTDIPLGKIKKFTWQVTSRRDYVKGKGKSQKYDLTVQRMSR